MLTVDANRHGARIVSGIRIDKAVHKMSDRPGTIDNSLLHFFIFTQYSKDLGNEHGLREYGDPDRDRRTFPPPNSWRPGKLKKALDSDA